MLLLLLHYHTFFVLLSESLQLQHSAYSGGLASCTNVIFRHCYSDWLWSKHIKVSVTLLLHSYKEELVFLCASETLCPLSRHYHLFFSVKV